MTSLIGLVGYAGSGKSTAAEQMVGRLGYVRAKFAGPLKDMLRSIGLTDAEIEGPLKEQPCSILCGKTPRHAMITLGTEWGRDQIGQDFWINLFVRRVDKLRNCGHMVVVDDVRFPNEVKVIREMGGKIIKVLRPGLKPDLGHASEQFVQGIESDYVVINRGTRGDLGNALVSAHRELYGAP